MNRATFSFEEKWNEYILEIDYSDNYQMNVGISSKVAVIVFRNVKEKIHPGWFSTPLLFHLDTQITHVIWFYSSYILVDSASLITIMSLEPVAESQKVYSVSEIQFEIDSYCE